MEGAILQIVNSDPVCRAKGVKLYQTIVRNITENPEQEKFRSLNKEKLGPRLHQTSGLLALLFAVGFTETPTHYNLPSSADLSNLTSSAMLLSAATEEEKSDVSSVQAAPVASKAAPAQKTQAQLELEKITAERAAEVKRFKAEKERRKKEMAERIARARKEKEQDLKDRPIQASVAEKRKFGATQKKVEFAQGGGG
mmetsp:Transcript_1689/g.2208  ORF Transcript_1689/g.2208 Transcript_1689/m.2208 type:complete len:197 (-) Transcript_1689:182-772(-)